MSDIITLADGLCPDGIYRVHLMSNEAFEYELPPYAKVKRSVEAGACVLVAEWRFRGPCKLIDQALDWKRVVVLWALEKGKRVSEQGIEAARLYREVFGEWPEHLWLHELPKGKTEPFFLEIPGTHCELVVNAADFLAEFVPKDFIAVE